MIGDKPLRDRVKILKDDDWDEIEHVAMAMFIENGRLEMIEAEYYAMMGVIERRELAQPCNRH